MVWVVNTRSRELARTYPQRVVRPCVLAPHDLTALLITNREPQLRSHDAIVYHIQCSGIIDVALDPTRNHMRSYQLSIATFALSLNAVIRAMVSIMIVDNVAASIIT